MAYPIKEVCILRGPPLWLLPVGIGMGVGRLLLGDQLPKLLRRLHQAVNPASKDVLSQTISQTLRRVLGCPKPCCVYSFVFRHATQPDKRPWLNQLHCKLAGYVCQPNWGGLQIARVQTNAHGAACSPSEDNSGTQAHPASGDLGRRPDGQPTGRQCGVQSLMNMTQTMSDRVPHAVNNDQPNDCDRALG